MAIVKFLLKMMGQKCKLAWVLLIENGVNAQYNNVTCLTVAFMCVNDIKQCKYLKAVTCHLYF